MEIYKEVNGKKLRKSVIAFVVREDGKFLCMKRHPDLRSYPGEWSFCGGKCDEEDTNSNESVSRELWEETSIKLLMPLNEIESLKYPMIFDDEKAGYSIEFYVIPAPLDIRIEINPKEHIDYFWCPIELGLNILTEKIPESRKFFKQYYNLNE